MLKDLGISIIPASAPDFFTEDTPTAILVRQVLGAIAQSVSPEVWLGSYALRRQRTGSAGTQRQTLND